MKKIILFSVLTFFIIDDITAQTLPNLIPYRKGNKWGYCDSTKKIVIEPKWEEANFFSEGLANVMLNGKYGYIDTTGRVIINYKYTWSGDFYNGIADVEYKNSKFLIINKKDEILFSRKHYGEFGIWGLQNSTMILYALSKDWADGGIKESDSMKIHKGSFAVYNYNMQQVIPFDYSKILETNSERYFVVSKCNSIKYYYGLYDTLLKREIIPCSFDSDTNKLFKESLNKYKVFTMTVNDNKFSSNSELKKDSNFIITKKGDKLGLINSNGRTIIPFEYFDIEKTYCGLYSVYHLIKNRIIKVGYYNSSGTKYFEE